MKHLKSTDDQHPEVAGPITAAATMRLISAIHPPPPPKHFHAVVLIHNSRMGKIVEGKFVPEIASDCSSRPNFPAAASWAEMLGFDDPNSRITASTDGM
jgi:hypothetical protein